MATNKRIYGVVAEGQQPRLIRAATQAQAIGHVVKDTYRAAVPTPDELVDLVSKGVKVEDANPEPAGQQQLPEDDQQ